MNRKESTVQKCVLVPVDKYKKLLQNLSVQKQMVGEGSGVDKDYISSPDRKNHTYKQIGGRGDDINLRETGSEEDNFVTGKGTELGQEIKSKHPPPPGESDKEIQLESEWGWEKYWQPILN